MVLGIVVVVYAAGKWVPAPSVISAPVVIDYESVQTVRAETSGFIRDILVEDQQWVRQGTLLMTLENPHLKAQKSKVDLQLAQSDLRLRALQNSVQIAEWQAEQAENHALNEHRIELENQIKNLEVRAPLSGRVFARKLPQMLGQYVEPGSDLVTFGNEQKKQAIALISQENAIYVNQHVGQPTELRIDGIYRCRGGFLKSIDPQAVDDLPHFALAGIHGGPLDVVSRESLESPIRPRNTAL